MELLLYDLLSSSEFMLDFEKVTLSTKSLFSLVHIPVLEGAFEMSRYFLQKFTFFAMWVH